MRINKYRMIVIARGRRFGYSKILGLCDNLRRASGEYKDRPRLVDMFFPDVALP